MDVLLRCVTLNCWALPQPYPIGSKDRSYRLAKLVEALAAGHYDIVALQELWSDSDYEKIKSALAHLLPFAHYFHSGFTGSGVCILSRFPIVSTLMHRYSLNGYAHHIHRGDWFGGKVVGMVELEIGDYAVNVYSTHLHAQYDETNDLYFPHRLSQAFEVSQFVKHTSKGADLCILTGDFNMEPTDLGYRMILSNGHMRDAWTSRPNKEHLDVGATCERPDNVYTPKSMLVKCPDGKRLDYIMYKGGRTDANVELVHCDNRLNKITENEDDINFSDHIAVYAEFHIRGSKDVLLSTSDDQHSAIVNTSQAIPFEKTTPLLARSVKIMEQGEKRAHSNKRVYIAAIVIVAALIISTVFIELNYSHWTLLMLCIRFFLTLLIGFCVWYGAIGLTMEEKALKAAKLSMLQLMNDSDLDEEGKL